jgi:N-methylhydantoinase A
MENAVKYRAGIDIGGTFTDIVLMAENQRTLARKVPSTPSDYSSGIVSGLGALLRAVQATGADVTEVVHATTVATNTILEGKGALTGLITTRGFRDVLEIGRLRVPRLYDLGYTKPQSLALRRHRYEVGERILADGTVEQALDPAEIERVAQQIRRDRLQAVAICLLNSYVNPAHERSIQQRLATLLDAGVYVSASCDVLPEIREYERTSTTVVNAYLGPIVRSYLSTLTARLRDIGVTAPLRIMQSNGGLMTAEEAIDKPAYIIESGPAAGVIAGAHVSALSGFADVITVDMGGTTAKAAIIEGGEPARTTEYEVGSGINLSSKLIKGAGYAVKLPFIDVSEIGAGGGSLVEFDSGGLLKVGPQSAGAVPGPVCYDAGNSTPTLTDAFVALGYLNPQVIAGGEVRLNSGKAVAALSERIATPLGLPIAQACLGIQAVSIATMSRAVNAVSTYRGRDPRDFTLFAFGGNGPMIAVELAKSMGMRRVIIPPDPGVFSAKGLLFSRLEREFTESAFGSLRDVAATEFADGFVSLERRARETLNADGYRVEDLTFHRFADLRYEGQAFELTVPVAAATADGTALEKAIRGYHEEHQRTYGHHSPSQAVEIVNRRLKVVFPANELPPDDPWRATDAATSQLQMRQAFFEQAGALSIPVVTRSQLTSPRQGPLIIEEYDSTCVIPPDASVVTDRAGNLIITL